MKKNDKKTKKKENSIIEGALLAVLNTSLRKCINQALDDIFRELNNN